MALVASVCKFWYSKQRGSNPDIEMEAETKDPVRLQHNHEHEVIEPGSSNSD